MRFHHLALAALAAVASMHASAASFDFSNLEYVGGVNTGFLPSDGDSCTGGDLCSSNVDGNIRNGDLTYSTGGLTVRATGSYLGGVAAVVQDHENAYSAANKIGAGLGVYHVSGNTSDDNITFGEMLTLTFDQAVTITNIGLRSEGHNVTGWISGATFLLDGVSTLLPANVGSIGGLTLTGTEFTFAYGGVHPDQFYLSSVTAVAAVPEPETYALLLAGLGVVGFVARRRKQEA